MATVTCHTEGCGNAGVPIELDLTFYNDETGETEVAGAVACGACSTPIEDIEPPLASMKE